MLFLHKKGQSTVLKQINCPPTYYPFTEPNNMPLAKCFWRKG